MVEEKKQRTLKIITFFLTRFIFIASFVISSLNGDYLTAFQCLTALAVFGLRDLIYKRFNIEFPRGFEIAIIIFVFASVFFGEMNDYYAKVPFWDKALHTTSGFLIAAIGFSLIDLLNKNKRTLVHLSPFFEAMFAFCFSMTILVLWEFFEFGVDYFFLEDMQADYFVTQFSSKIAYGTLKGTHITDITKVVIEYGGGQELVLDKYIDIGNKDTMLDLIVGACGALVFSVIGYFALKRSSKARRVVGTFVIKEKGQENIFEKTSEMTIERDDDAVDLEISEDQKEKREEKQ